ncbi:unnamed protein product, partial [Allacma fusca]
EHTRFFCVHQLSQTNLLEVECKHGRRHQFDCCVSGHESGTKVHSSGLSTIL